MATRIDVMWLHAVSSSIASHPCLDYFHVMAPIGVRHLISPWGGTVFPTWFGITECNLRSPLQYAGVQKEMKIYHSHGKLNFPYMTLWVQNQDVSVRAYTFCSYSEVSRCPLLPFLMVPAHLTSIDIHGRGALIWQQSDVVQWPFGSNLDNDRPL